jgi:hypothetical protein
MDQKSRPISPDQLKKLQTLYGQLVRHTDQGADRVSRIAWAQQLVSRPICTFSDLTSDEAHQLIDTLQGQLGIAAPHKRRLSRRAAQAAGTEGRKGFDSNETTLAGAAEFKRIQYALDQLGWNQAQFDAWLRSSRSPLPRKANPVLRTLYDANRVWWALKRILKSQGKWQKAGAA